jgi:hypothetical protein
MSRKIVRAKRFNDTHTNKNCTSLGNLLKIDNTYFIIN